MALGEILKRKKGVLVIPVYMADSIIFPEPIPSVARYESATALEPPRYKMAIVTGAVIFVIINTFFPLIQNSTAGLPDLLQALILVVILTVLMTYVIMPTITWLLRPWLSKKKLF